MEVSPCGGWGNNVAMCGREPPTVGFGSWLQQNVLQKMGFRFGDGVGHSEVFVSMLQLRS